MSHLRGQKLSSKLLLLLLCLISWGGYTHARVIEIVRATQLELRNVEVAGGKQEFIILSGSPVEIKIDDNTLQANRIEFNKTERHMRLIGNGLYISRTKNSAGNFDSQEFMGEDLRVDLKQEGVAGNDVIVTTKEILVTGEEAQRLPGQIQVQSSLFTPCGRCGQTPYDYAFRAKTLIIYPGDRLVAEHVTVLIADVPVFYLPLAVLFINDPSRQPRLEFGNKDPDGRTVLADLPYVLGNNQLGFNYLRYYDNRPSHWAFGISHSIYRLLDASDNLEASFFLIPKRKEDKYEWNYNVQYKGNLPLANTVSGINVDLNILRRDTTATSTVAATSTTAPELDMPVKGAVQPKETSLDLTATAKFSPFTSKLIIKTYFDHDESSKEIRQNTLPELSLYEFKPLNVGAVQYKPEITIGRYNAPVDATNRSAVIAARNGNITATRFKYKHDLKANWNMWSGGAFGISQAFTGQYYSTDEAAVDYAVSANFKQTSSWFGVALGYTFGFAEGESPFAFDRIPPRDGTHNLNASVDIKPAPWFSLNAKQSYLLHKKWGDDQPDFTVNAVLNPKELSLTQTLDYSYNFFQGKAKDLSLKASLDTGRFNTSVATGYSYYSGTNPVMRYKNLTFTAGFKNATPTWSINYTYNYDINKQVPLSQDIKASIKDKWDDTPYGLEFNQLYKYPNNNTYTTQNHETSGSLSLNYNDITLKVDNQLYFADSTTTPLKGKLDFTITKSFLKVYYGGAYDLQRNGFIAPELSLSYIDKTEETRSIDFSVTYAMRGLDRDEAYFKSAQFKLGWQWSEQFATATDVSFVRVKNTDGFYDTVNVNNLYLAYAWGKVGSQPEWILTGKLKQTFNFNPTNTKPFDITPTIALVYNRCCWTALAEYNFEKHSWRVALNLMGGEYRNLLNINEGTVKVLPDLIGGL